MNRLMKIVVTGFMLVSAAQAATAFCGFYVASGDAKLFNQASTVVMVRDENRTVLTMSNDYKGDPEAFALVVPVPVVLTEDQIRITEQKYLTHLESYSAPRLVQYYDGNPCPSLRTRISRWLSDFRFRLSRDQESAAGGGLGQQSLGVTVEAQYTVGEYEIVILSAEQSDGLETWLRINQYRIPEGASEVLAEYIEQGMRFFVARVDLAEQSRLGYNMLRPIQISFESDEFMLPIRLGMVNADGPQELFVLTLTRGGRVETTNYATVPVETDILVPEFVEHEFPEFYRALFTKQLSREEGRAVILEYAWDLAWCDPCAGEPVSTEELRELGVWWLEEDDWPEAAITRLHLRYDADHFPEDLTLEITENYDTFQGRYIIRRPWTGSTRCRAGREYIEALARRQQNAATNLAEATGWDIDEIRAKMELEPPESDVQG